MFLTIMRLIVRFSLYQISTVRLKLPLQCYIIMQEVSENLIETNSDCKDIRAYTKNPRNSPNSQCILRLLSDQLQIRTNEKIHHSIELADFIGFNAEMVDQTQHLCKLILNTFPRMGATCSQKSVRKLAHYALWLDLKQDELQDLKVDLIKAASNRKIKSSKDLLKFLVYLNPNAGANSRSHLQAISKFIRFTNFTFDLIETTHRGHCKEHLDQLDVSSYDSVVIISGDGLMHEFVNSKACGKIPVTHVPGGSGNAFAKAQTTLAEQDCKDEQAIFLAIKGRISSMNLVRMELEKEPQPIYSFLSLEWAFLADIDMNSEFLRCCGGLRFQVYAVYRCLALHRYPARLTFSTSELALPPLSEPITNPNFKQVETNFLNAIFLSIPFISDKYQWGPLLKVQDQAIDMQYITEEHGRYQLIKYLLSSDKGDHFDKEQQAPKEGYQFVHNKIKSYRLEPLGEGDNLGIFGIDGERYQAQRMQAFMSDVKILTFI